METIDQKIDKNVILSYDEFEEIIPDETLYYIDIFLAILNENFDHRYNDDPKINKKIYFLSFLYRNLYDLKIVFEPYIPEWLKNRFENYDFDFLKIVDNKIQLDLPYEDTMNRLKFLKDNDRLTKNGEKELLKFMRYNENQYNKLRLYSDFSPCFLLHKNKYEYASLTIEDLFYENLIDVIEYTDHVCDRQDIDVVAKIRYIVDESISNKCDSLKVELFKGYDSTVINYFENASKFLKHNLPNKINNDFILWTLLNGFYVDNCRDVINYLEEYNLDLEKINSYITDNTSIKFTKIAAECRIINKDPIRSKHPDIRIIYTYYQPYLKKVKNVSDVLKKLLDKNNTDNYLFLQMLAYYEIDNKIFDICQTDNVENQKYITELSTKDDKTKKYLKRVYNIYEKLKKNDSEYDSINVFKACFIACFYDSDKFSSFFVNNDVTKEKVSAYYKIDLNETQKIDDVSDGDLVSILKFFPKGYDKDSLKMDCIEFNDVRNDIENIGSCVITSDSIKKYIADLDYKNEVKKLSKIYNGLSDKLISFIRICSMKYDSLKPKLKKFYNDNDILELAIISCFAYLNFEESDYLDLLFNRNISYYDFDHQTFYKIDDELKVDESEIKGNILLIEKIFPKYIFGGVNKDIERCNIKPVDIVNNCFNKNLNYSKNLLKILENRKLNYDIFSGNFKYNYIRQRINKVKTNDLIIIDNLNKVLNNELIKNGIDDNKFANQLAIFINTINTNEIINSCFMDNGLTTEKILSALNIDVDKIKVDETLDYEHIKKNINGGFSYIFLTKGIEPYIEMVISNINEREYKNLYNLFNSILTTNISKLQKDFENRDRNEKIYNMGKIKVPTISTINFDTISSFDSGLRKQAEDIVNNFLDFTTKDDTDNFNEIEEDIEGLYKLEKKSKFKSIFSKKKEVDTIDKKELIIKIEHYLKEKEEKLEKGLVELDYLKKAINVYLKNTTLYLDRITEVRNELIEEVKTKEYIENDIEISDDNLKMQLINDKIACINASIVQMMQQYKKVVLQISTHASLLNYINVSRNTTIKNLYLEFVLNDGVKLENDSINYLKSLKGLLNYMEDYTNKNVYINKNNIENLIKNDSLSLENNSIEYLKVLKNLLTDNSIDQNLDNLTESKNKKYLK